MPLGTTRTHRTGGTVHRPVLHPALRRAWRDHHTLQVGLGPAAALLTGLGAADEALLAAMDGTRDLAALRRVAVGRGAPARRADDVLAVLRGAGLLLDGQDPPVRARLAPDADGLAATGSADGAAAVRARAAARVAVDGSGRVGAALAVTLAAAGVGEVRATGHDVGRPVREADLLPSGHAAVDVGARRGTSLARAVARTGGATALPAQTARPHAPHVVVIVRDDAVASGAADEPARRRRAAPVGRGARRPGGGRPVRAARPHPCLRCLDLHRRDRDPGWPAVQAQARRRLVEAPG
ncbi:hypothetical protein GCM10025868_37530 [Angustibacter aerolatus]|uniref:THIF-type NAD/FAD binding fold domain-containing protein n=1 Tax=Angustibacter aerolatus TaxID=1162965 RepID=A0ABQ6JMA2_9ACTN|nr:hypothetical protein [Angustibacter aerolatus]GMA88503.1 hypothetical protein GCM10025868_37530 [Angustibacter aerolatus]